MKRLLPVLGSRTLRGLLLELDRALSNGRAKRHESGDTSVAALALSGFSLAAAVIRPLMKSRGYMRVHGVLGPSNPSSGVRQSENT
jgi:hypothetical protein